MALAEPFKPTRLVLTKPHSPQAASPTLAATVLPVKIGANSVAESSQMTDLHGRFQAANAQFS